MLVSLTEPPSVSGHLSACLCDNTALCMSCVHVTALLLQSLSVHRKSASCKAASTWMVHVGLCTSTAIAVFMNTVCHKLWKSVTYTKPQTYIQSNFGAHTPCSTITMCLLAAAKTVQSRAGRWCEHCHAWQELRAKHCHVCSRCVRRFDHHCAWTNNCVGEGNHARYTRKSVHMLCKLRLLNGYNTRV